MVQCLTAERYACDVEYRERISVGGGGFDAVVEGDWMLRNTASLLTGEPTVTMVVEPGVVRYGGTETKADHWKSVRSMNVLDMTYLDDSLRVMRGNTSTDTIFIFAKS